MTTIATFPREFFMTEFFTVPRVDSRQLFRVLTSKVLVVCVQRTASTTMRRIPLVDAAYLSLMRRTYKATESKCCLNQQNNRHGRIMAQTLKWLMWAPHGSTTGFAVVDLIQLVILANYILVALAMISYAPLYRNLNRIVVTQAAVILVNIRRWHNVNQCCGWVASSSVRVCLL